MPKDASRSPTPLLVLYILFFLSGFSGLIYESVWTRYLKLFLGHAAYAQTLVLVTFMGGMAIGAWLAGRYSPRIVNLLRGYAVVEFVIGLGGIIFHPFFQAVTGYAYSSLIPTLSSGLAVTMSKWLLAAFMILPQSILLGATFPLMAGGIIRLAPRNPGRTLGVLYFSNSFGAFFGVLASGFLLIKWVGLPGTILTAGLLNILLALVVWSVATRYAASLPGEAECRQKAEYAQPEPTPSVGPVQEASGKAKLGLVILACSAITGSASFLYEIGWIRMLSLVLGSTTHSFELMLSAFILGLALGGYWIRIRIEHLKNPILTLGVIQLVMGLLALSTLLAYGNIFELMRIVVLRLPRTDNGYLLFNLCSHLLAILLMLPATFCAGMTLPLLTSILLRRNFGEQAIGRVYSTNTLGGIVGVILGIQFIMVPFGVKHLITAGCLLDLSAGVYLVFYAVGPELRRRWIWYCSSAGLTWAGIFFFYPLDTVKMASGVYRTGNFIHDSEILYHRDGKTASIDIYRLGNLLNFSTNGKSDAGISVTDLPSKDELTTTLLAALPLAIHPEAREAAVIGLGSGLTTRSLLLDPGLTRVDTIEIEPAMVEGVRRHGIRSGEVFSDPRSRIYIEDAKVFFTNQGSRYDLIISEPSNPWISGISSMFSSEFYGLARKHLSETGLFVQWFHIYDNNIELVASVMKSLAGQFEDYAVYFPVEGDLIIIASAHGKVNDPGGSIFQIPQLAAELSRLDINGPEDLLLRRLGGKQSLEPYFRSFEIAENSDFFPVLDLQASRSRFLTENALELLRPVFSPLSPVEILEKRLRHPSPTSISDSRGEKFFTATRARRAVKIHGYLCNLPGESTATTLSAKDVQLLKRLLAADEGQAMWRQDLHILAGITLPFLSQSEIAGVLSRVEEGARKAPLSDQERAWLLFYRSVAGRDYPGLLEVISQIRTSTDLTEDELGILLLGEMIGHCAKGDPRASLQAWKQYGPSVPMTTEISLVVANCLQRLSGNGDTPRQTE